MRRLADEDGATAIFVALLLILMLGISALVLDVGNMYWERRQLQNGADASSLAVALDLAKEAATENTTPGAGELGDPYSATAKSYADANSADGVSDLDSLSLNPVDSIPLTRAGEVTAITLVNDAGVNELSHWIAPILGFDASRVVAPAAAIYGPLGAVDGAFPVVVCETEYDNGGEVFEIVLKRPPGQGGQVPTDCPTDPDVFPTGQTPGNFSWLEPTGEGCTVDFDLDDPQMPGDPGVPVPNGSGCPAEAAEIAAGINAYNAGTTDELPIRHIAVFERVDGTGSGTLYTISKLAAFEFHGIKTVIPGHGQTNAVVGSWSTGPDSCNGNSSNTDCVKGRFTGDTATGEIDLGADSDLLGVEMTR